MDNKEIIKSLSKIEDILGNLKMFLRNLKIIKKDTMYLIQ